MNVLGFDLVIVFAVVAFFVYAKLHNDRITQTYQKMRPEEAARHDPTSDPFPSMAEDDVRRLGEQTAEGERP